MNQKQKVGLVLSVLFTLPTLYFFACTFHPMPTISEDARLAAPMAILAIVSAYWLAYILTIFFGSAAVVSTAPNLFHAPRPVRIVGWILAVLNFGLIAYSVIRLLPYCNLFGWGV